MSGEEEQYMVGMSDTYINLHTETGLKILLSGRLEYLGSTDLALSDEEKAILSKIQQNKKINNVDQATIKLIKQKANELKNIQDISEKKVEYWRIGNIILRYICKRKESLATKLAPARRKKVDPSFLVKIQLMMNLILSMFVILLFAGMMNAVIFYNVILPLGQYADWIVFSVIWGLTIAIYKMREKVYYANLATTTKMIVDAAIFKLPNGTVAKNVKIVTVLLYQSDVIPWVQADVVKLRPEDLQELEKITLVELVKALANVAKKQEELQQLKNNLNALGNILREQYYMGMASAININKSINKSLSSGLGGFKLTNTLVFLLVTFGLMALSGFLIFSGSTIGLVVGAIVALLTVVLMLYTFSSVFAVKTRQEMSYD